MKALRFSMLLVLVSALALLAPLALANPPDPNWIRGLYDDGDLDNVISIITLSDAWLEPSPLDASSTPIVIALLNQTDERSAPSEALPVMQARAPPAL
jgi:hypothetical protein